MKKRFMYFENMEGGMDTFEFSTVNELSCLSAWGDARCQEDDDALADWVANAEIGDVFNHRCGYAVRLRKIDDEIVGSLEPAKPFRGDWG